MPDIARNAMEGQVTTKLGRVSVNPRGEYQAEETYNRLDIVQFGGSGWLCLKDNTTQIEPVEGDNWMRFADNGGAATVEQAKTYAEQAKASQEDAANSKQEASDSATAAGEAETRAKQAAQDAQTAKTDAETAQGEAERYAQEASEKATAADTSAQNASSSETAAAGSADRAEEAAKHVEEVVGGDVVTHPELEAALATKADVADIQGGESLSVETAEGAITFDIKSGGKLDTSVGVIEKGINILTRMPPDLFGFSRDLDNSDPDARIEYLYEASGMTPAKMTLGSTFSCGGWSDVWFVNGNYVCMLEKDGHEAYKLDPNDYSKRADGDPTASGYATLKGNTLNCMSAIPTVWVKRYTKGRKEYVILCEQQYDDSFHAYAHTDAQGRVKEHFYHAAFEGCNDSTSTMRSIGGQAPGNTTTAEAERTAAQKNGTGWDIRPWSAHILIADMCTLISKTDNSQAAFGYGHITGGAAATNLLQTGALHDKGQFWGDTEAQNTAVKVFHIENFWGDRWDRLVGLMNIGGVWLAKMTPENGGYNLTGAGYEALPRGYEGITAVSGSGSQSETITTDLGTVPIKFAGTNTTYTCDWMWYATGTAAVARAGGGCVDGLRCGSRCLSASAAASAAHWYFGGSPFFV